MTEECFSVLMDFSLLTGMQALVFSPICLAFSYQINLLDSRCHVALVPEWDSPWMMLKTFLCQANRTINCGFSVLTSHSRVLLLGPKCTSCKESDMLIVQ